MTTSATVKNKQPDAPQSEQPRKVPVIPSANIVEQMKGNRFCEWFIGLPEGAILDDLRDASIWRAIQTTDKRLALYDRVTIVDFECAWMIEARVVGSTSVGVTLALGKKYDLDPRTQALPQTETHKVVFTPSGYAVQSKRTGNVEGGMYYQSLATVSGILFSIAPRKVA